MEISDVLDDGEVATPPQEPSEAETSGAAGDEGDAPSMWSQGRQGEAKHWEHDQIFVAVEQERRSINSNNSQGGLFLSHCWRDPSTQAKKRMIAARLSTPSEEGGPGNLYWADWLDLQAEGPVPWRKEIETGIQNCSKFVALVDTAWLTSFNCLQELAMAFAHGKPVVVLVLTQEAWELLVVPGGAEQAKSLADVQHNADFSEVRPHEAPENSPDITMAVDAGCEPLVPRATRIWKADEHGVPLVRYKDEEIVPGEALSLATVRELFSRLASINLCPCRELEVTNKGLDGMLDLAEEYVAKDLVYYKQHAQLKALAQRWEVGGKRRQHLLQLEEASEWRDWLQGAAACEMEPRPTEAMSGLAAASLAHAKRRGRLTRVLFAAFVLALVAGGPLIYMVVRSVRLTSAAQALAAELTEALTEVETANNETKEALAEAETARAEAQLNNKQLVATMSLAALDSAAPVSRPWELKTTASVLDRLIDPLVPAVSASAMDAIRTKLARPHIAPPTELQGTGGLAEIIAWSPSLLVLATSHSDSVYLWNGADTTAAPLELSLEPDQPDDDGKPRVADLAWSPLGTRLAVLAVDTTYLFPDIYLHMWTLYPPDGSGELVADKLISLYSLFKGVYGSLTHAVRFVLGGSKLICTTYTESSYYNPYAGLLAMVVLSPSTSPFSSLEEWSVEESYQTNTTGLLDWAEDGGRLAYVPAENPRTVTVLTLSSPTASLIHKQHLEPPLDYITGNITALSWSKHGQLLATSDTAGIIRVWGLRAGPSSGLPLLNITATLTWHSQLSSFDPCRLSWSPGSELLAYEDCTAGTVQVWNVTSPSSSPTVDQLAATGPGEGREISWSPVTTPPMLLATSTDGSASPEAYVLTVNETDGLSSWASIQLPIYETDMYAVSWSPGGDHAVLGSGNKLFVVPVAMLPNTTSLVDSSVMWALSDSDSSECGSTMDWSPDGSQLACSNMHSYWSGIPSSVLVWNLQYSGDPDPALLQEYQLEPVAPGPPYCVSWGAGSGQLAVSSNAEAWTITTQVKSATNNTEYLNLLPETTQRVIQALPLSAMAWRPSGQYLATADVSGLVTVYPSSPSGSLDVDAAIEQVAFVAAPSQYVNFYDYGEEEEEEDWVGPVLAWSPSAAAYPALLAAGNNAGSIWVWLADELLQNPSSPLTAQQLQVAGMNIAITDLNFAPSTLLLAAGLSSSTSWLETPLRVALWTLEKDGTVDPATMQSLSFGLYQSPDPTYLSWSPSGSHLLVGFGEKLLVLEMQTNGTMSSTPLVEIQSGHTRAITAVSWSPTGHQLLSASLDGLVRIWDCQGILDPDFQLAYPQVLGGGILPVYSADWSPDGRQIVTVDDSGTVHVYGLTTVHGMRTYVHENWPAVDWTLSPAELAAHDLPKDLSDDDKYPVLSL